MLYKRSRKPGSHWWVRFTSNKVEVRQSSGTDRKESAEAFEQQLREAIWDEQNLGIEIHTWDEAVARWMREKAHKKSLARDVQAITKMGIPGSTELGRMVPPDAASTAARELAVYRSILNACVVWNWLDRAPKVVMPHAEKHDPRWITKEQFEALCKELPAHAKALATFAVYTGLRSANVRRLRWADVDMAKGLVHIHANDSKSRRSMGIPMSGRAIRVLRGAVGNHPDYVFTDDQGRAPVGSVKTTWLKAVKRAGLEGFRFHDLRHTWAAWHVMAGTPPMILKELGGWASLAMVERYGHINPGHLADWADNSKVRGTKTGTRKKRK